MLFIDYFLSWWLLFTHVLWVSCMFFSVLFFLLHVTILVVFLINCLFFIVLCKLDVKLCNTICNTENGHRKLFCHNVFMSNISGLLF
jgi:hypothetical protein